MPNTLRGVTIAVALLGSAGLAFAAGGKSPGASSSTQMQSGTTGQATGSPSKSGATAGELNLTESQKESIAQKLASEPAASDASFQASEGAKVPASIALKPVPMELSTEIPSVKEYSYAKLQNNDIVLVDPKERTVAAVIEGEASTTGSSAAPSGSGSMSKPGESPGSKKQ